MNLAKFSCSSMLDFGDDIVGNQITPHLHGIVQNDVLHRKIGQGRLVVDKLNRLPPPYGHHTKDGRDLHITRVFIKKNMD